MLCQISDVLCQINIQVPLGALPRFDPHTVARINRSIESNALNPLTTWPLHFGIQVLKSRSVWYPGIANSMVIKPLVIKGN